MTQYNNGESLNLRVTMAHIIFQWQLKLWLLSFWNRKHTRPLFTTVGFEKDVCDVTDFLFE